MKRLAIAFLVACSSPSLESPPAEVDAGPSPVCDAAPEAAPPKCIFVESFSKKCALAIVTPNYVVCPGGVEPPKDDGCVGAGREWCCPSILGL